MAKKIAPRKASSIDARRVKVGDVIKGKYQVLQLIGRGGMSRVYLAMDLDLANKQWAIKEVDRNACDPTGRPMEQSLAREANLLARFDHPNIVRIVDTVETPDFIYVSWTMWRASRSTRWYGTRACRRRRTCSTGCCRFVMPWHISTGRTRR